MVVQEKAEGMLTNRLDKIISCSKIMSSPISPIQSRQSSYESSMRSSAMHSRTPSAQASRSSSPLLIVQPPYISPMRRFINGVKWFGATFLPGVALTTCLYGAYKLSRFNKVKPPQSNFTNYNRYRSRR